jgi:hypothetical protein
VSTQEIDFTAGTDRHPNDPHVETPGRVRQVAVPPAARTLSTPPTSTTRTPSLWRSAPPTTGRASNGPARSWRTLRSSYDTRSGGAGSRSACGSAQLGLTDTCSAGRCGAAPGRRAPCCQLPPRLPAEPLCKRQQHTLRFATFVQQENQIPRAVWARGRARASTGRAVPPRAGRPQDS